MVGTTGMLRALTSEPQGPTGTSDPNQPKTGCATLRKSVYTDLGAGHDHPFLFDFASQLRRALIRATRVLPSTPSCLWDTVRKTSPPASLYVADLAGQNLPI